MAYRIADKIIIDDDFRYCIWISNEDYKDSFINIFFIRDVYMDHKYLLNENYREKQISFILNLYN